MVPHEDDEIFIGGALIYYCCNYSDYETYIYIATNGDSNMKICESNYRVKESIKGLTELGVEKTHIYFGGYGDRWIGKHLYNASQNERLLSVAQRTETGTGDDTVREYHYLKYGQHANYTRLSYYDDLNQLILDILPTVIVGVDLDAHPDHRCLSLMLDEVLHNIFVTNEEYRPFLLKKYAYEGMLYGVKDLFTSSLNRTEANNDETSNPFFLWKDRVAYIVPEKCRTKILCNNIVFKSSLQYKSQNIWFNADAFINSDVVYWSRHTRNFLIDAEIQVSSGDAKYLNDFKLLDSPDICEKKMDLFTLCWRPDLSDEKKQIDIVLKKKTKIAYINIYFNNVEGTLIKCAKLTILDALDKVIIEMPFSEIRGKEYIIHTLKLENVYEAKRIIISFNDVIGTIGIGEIEVLDEEQRVPFDELLIDKQRLADETGIIQAWSVELSEFLFKTKRFLKRHCEKVLK